MEPQIKPIRRKSRTRIVRYAERNEAHKQITLMKNSWYSSISVIRVLWLK